MITETYPRVKELFGVELKILPIEIMTRSRTMAGQFTHKRNGTPVRYKFSLYHLERVDFEEFYREVVLHEVTHYLQVVLFGYTGHDVQFLTLDRAIGGTGKAHHDFGCGWHYKCPGCGKVSKVTTKRKNNMFRRGMMNYRCGRCHASLDKVVFVKDDD